jgi:hypothetical protein
MHFLTVYYNIPQLQHVSTHARNHQGAFLFFLILSVPLCYENMNIYVRRSNTILKDVNILVHKATYIIYVLPEMFFVRLKDG